MGNVTGNQPEPLLYLCGRQEVKDERRAPGAQFAPHSLHGCTTCRDESTSLVSVLNKEGGGGEEWGGGWGGQSEGEKAGNDMRSEAEGGGGGDGVLWGQLL